VILQISTNSEADSSGVYQVAK